MWEQTAFGRRLFLRDRIPRRRSAGGLAYEEAARLLGCPVGTIKSRLSRGRERLRVRMARRGVAPSPGVLVATVSKSLVPSTLRDTTAHAAIRFTMHAPPAVGTVSTMAAALTEGMLKSMNLFRLKIAVVVLSLTGLGATAVGVLTGSVVGEQLRFAPRQTARDDVSPIPVISAIRFQGNNKISSDRINGEIATRVG
jgi:Sigma-70, region 4